MTYSSVSYTHRLAVGASILWLVWAMAASAQTVLTVEGSGSDPIVQEYTIEDLDAMDQRAVATTLDFVDGMPTFTGPLARDVLMRIGATEDQEVRMFAINDYEVLIPMSDFLDYDVILSTRLNGNLHSRRDYGPIWVIYPREEHPELKDSLYNARLIWQLVRMEVE